MLQQTQASRVVQRYPRFLKRFPTLLSLAQARRPSVIRAWRGMGYNNRAVRLQQLARVLQKEWAGKLPRDPLLLQQLPGIGLYTAHAIACFAFHQPVAVVDTNVRRILARLFLHETRRRDAWDIAAEILPSKRAYDWNQALFDLGATVCTETKPRCALCPVQKLCPSAFKLSRTSRRVSRLEPSRDGVPNRLYRGRIVELLRKRRRNRALSSALLGKQVKENFTSRDLPWLYGLLKALQRDGLIALRTGSPQTLVSLAE